MKEKIIGVIVFIFLAASGWLERITSFFVWLVTLNATDTTISAISEAFVKIATFAISYFLVGLIFNCLKLFNSTLMRVAYFAISTLISFALCFLIMLIEQYITIIAVILFLVIVMTFIIYLCVKLSVRRKKNANKL